MLTVHRNDENQEKVTGNGPFNEKSLRLDNLTMVFASEHSQTMIRYLYKSINKFITYCDSIDW